MSETTQGLRLYNTLTRAKEDFVPIDPDNVRMYVCGPTVYDFAHIGNARPVIVFDVLFRLLRHRYGESHVTYVRNITDVDDKINARALRDFPDLPLNEAIARVTEKTAKQFHEDVAALGCLPPTVEPRATEFVLPRADGKTDMVTLIGRLIESGHAYEATSSTGSGGEVLFDVGSMPDYGRLSRRNLDEQQAGARVAVDAHKRNPADFVLWKQSSPDEPGWESPWGRGRPGWHIECSAMSDALLWDALKDKLSPAALARPHQFDIHGGGLDLIFPHHENEIAQSRCAHGTPVMANYWLHNGFLQVEGRKMSKSEGNFVTIDQILSQPLKFAMIERGTEKSLQDRSRRWNGLAARLVMLQTHYRSPIDWTHERFLQSRREIIAWHKLIQSAPSGVTEVVHWRDQHVKALLDDLNTSASVAELRRMYAINDWVQLKDAMLFLGLLDTILLESFDLIDTEIDSKIGVQIEHRLALIAEKNWAEADRIRDELLAQGIQLKDGKDPVTGERVTTWEVKR